MKLLTKEQEEAHYNETLKGGAIGGFVGLGIGTAGVLAASTRYKFFRGLTPALKAFLITSAGTFGGIVTADHYSRAFEKASNPKDREYAERERQKHEAETAGKTFTQRALDFGKKERYKIVGASWIASMIVAFSLVNRNPYLTGQQKLVQARVYAQFLTLGVLVSSAAFELSDRNNEEGRYETIKIIDPKDPEHKRIIERRREVEADSGDELWKDMVKAEEERLKERDEQEKEYKKHTQKKSGKKSGKKDEQDENKSDSKDDKQDKKKKDDSKGESKDKKDDSKDDKQDKKDDSKDDRQDKKDDSKDNKQEKKGDSDKNDKKDKKSS